MSNFVFYDFETSSSNKSWGQIIQVGAILTNDNLEELDRYEARCRLSPSIIPEAMALIVNKSTPKMLKSANLSHYEMIRQFVETLKRWGKVTYIGFNSIDFDEEFLRNTLFQTLKVQKNATQIYGDLRNITARFEKHFLGITVLRKKLDEAMKATDLFGRDGRSIMRTLENIKDPNSSSDNDKVSTLPKSSTGSYGQVEDSIEEKIEKIN